MRVLKRDMATGRMKLQVDTVDDLWHLSHVIEPGDRCTAVTHRRQERQEDRVRASKTEKVTVVLTVEAEEVSFDEFVNRLRILGTIVDGPEDVTGHHTHNIEAHQWIDITKPGGWHRSQRDRIREAVETAKEPRIVVVSLDEEEATVGVLQPYGVREVATVTSHRSGKGYTERGQKDTYFDDIMLALRESVPDDCPILVVGPGFTREHLAAALRQAGFAGVATEPTGQSGTVGIQEAIKRGAVTRVSDNVRLAVETEAVEEMLARIGQGALVAYGPAEVQAALDTGAVEQLLVTDELVRDDEGRRLLDVAHQTGAKVLVVGTGHDAGAELERFGGVGALLRYDVR